VSAMAGADLARWESHVVKPAVQAATDRTRRARIRRLCSNVHGFARLDSCAIIPTPHSCPTDGAAYY